MEGSQIDISPNIITYIKESYDLEIPKYIPEPIGYSIVILPLVGRKKTRGGIIIPDTSEEAIRDHAISALVLKIGPDAFLDSHKFPNGPHFKVGDFIQVEKYRGMMFQVLMIKENGEKDHVGLRLIDDDQAKALLPTLDHVKALQFGW